jgi:alkanesulfonate monooxygenase SsuD/methylene tetrahydromethanopterin reductase-like flavin-dependent oxidoreductase (luciferase family)
VRLGINLPFRNREGQPLDIAGIAARAQMLERAGFDSTWLPDSLVPNAQPRPDPLLWLLVAATATNNLELGTSVYVIPTRNPTELAQRFLTLHLVSGGRFHIGVGAGSTESAYLAAGVEFETRFKELHQRMRKIRRLCNGEIVDDADLRAWPSAIGGPPFLLGAWHSDISLRRAVSDYDGWICSAGRTSYKTITEAIHRYRELGGTRAMVANCYVDLTQKTKEIGGDDRFDLCCSPEEAIERLGRLAELGFDDVGLIKADPNGATKRYEADYSYEELAEIRALLPATSSVHAPSSPAL